MSKSVLVPDGWRVDSGPVLTSVPRIVLLALAWGSTFLWIDISLRSGLSPGQVTTGRCLIASACLGGVLLATRQALPGARHWPHLAVAALLCNTVPFLLFSLGQQWVTSGTAGILNATTPLWSLLLGLALGHDRKRRTAHYVGLGLGFLGVAALMGPADQGSTLGGGLLIAGAAASYAAAFTWMNRTLSGQGLTALPVATAQMLLATLFSVPLLLVSWTSPAAVEGHRAIAMLPLGVVCTALSFYLIVATIAEDGATNTAAVGYLVPVVALALGALVLRESLSVSSLVGMGVVLVGVALTRVRRSSTPPGPASDRCVDAGAPVGSAET